MPSSKNTPQALNKSTDERLLKPNEMSDAKNVTISTDSDGNGFVVKNAKGNAVIPAASGSQITKFLAAVLTKKTTPCTLLCMTQLVSTTVFTGLTSTQQRLSIKRFW